MEFIDLHGASGQAYRFRAWPTVGAHPPMAGAFAIVRSRGREVIAVGMLDNLADAPGQAAKHQPGVELFTRLNVSRAHREAENADLAAAYAASSTSAAA
jgi:hypothetical protein